MFSCCFNAVIIFCYVFSWTKTFTNVVMILYLDIAIFVYIFHKPGLWGSGKWHRDIKTRYWKSWALYCCPMGNGSADIHKYLWDALAFLFELVNLLWSSDSIWRRKSWPALAQVMACCLNQCWFLINEVRCHPHEGDFTIEITIISSSGQWV